MGGVCSVASVRASALRPSANRSGDPSHGPASTLRYVPSAFVALALGCVVSSCRCEQSERPYTPFGVATERAASNAESASSASPTASAAETPERSTPLTPPVARLEVDGVEVAAPEGSLVAHTLSYAPARSALAWLVPASKAGAQARAAGTLVLFERELPPKTVATLPAFVPTFDGCEHDVALRRTGPSSVTVDVNALCSDIALPARAPSRSIQVVLPERSEPVLLTLRLAPPTSDEILGVDVSSVDVDADGHDDIAATFSLQLDESDEPATAKLVWLSRAAGVARESAEPRKSFAELGSLETVRSKGKSTSLGVARRVQAARRLQGYLCSESGNPRLSDAEGRGVECGDLGVARDRFALAEVEAALTRGQVGEAILAVDLLPWYGGVTEATLKKLRERVETDAPSREALAVKLAVSPRDPGPAAALGPVAFAVDGSLLIQTVGGVQRFRAGELRDASEEVDPWRLVVEGPAAQTWLGATLPCEKPLVELQGRTKDGSFVTLLEGRWLAPRPSVCNGAKVATPEVRPVRWDSSGLGVLFGSAWLGSDQALEAPWLGSPVSANGRHWVAPTSLGLFLQHETSAELWQTQGFERLERCVVDNAGAQVACLTDGAVVLLTAAP
jgi:hypothetical protein